MESDRELADAVRQYGDESAFRTLYRRHTSRLYQVLLRVVDARADAEDAVQDTWVRAIAGLAAFRWESAFGTWLVGIGLHVARTIVRRRPDTEPLDGGEAAPDPAPADARLDVESALGALSAGQRTVLVLHDLEGWTHDEIAARLDVTAGTSKSQLFDARRRLRALLDTTPRSEAGS